MVRVPSAKNVRGTKFSGRTANVSFCYLALKRSFNAPLDVISMMSNEVKKKMDLLSY